MSDLIDRQEAIDAVDSIWGNIEAIMREHETEITKALHVEQSIKAVIKQVPSACKTVTDAVSKADVLEAYSDLYIVFDDCPGIIEELHKEYDELNKLPSAEPEPKKGKWTKENACEFCGYKPWYERDIHTLSYCPNCGADMRGGK